jgi:hypothetical protein
MPSIFRFALPDLNAVPTHFFQVSTVAFVSQNVSLELSFPVIDIRGRHGRADTIVTVPKAAVHENRDCSRREHEIRGTRQIGPV